MVTVRRDNDPFKKYWWALLVGFGFIGMWVLVPMAGQTGSGSVKVPQETMVEEQGLQSLDAADNPAGAPGSVIDLSMDGATKGYKKHEGDITSYLYQAPGGAKGAPITESASKAVKPKNLAAALKEVSKSDPSGWSGKKAQRGFSGGKASFGGFSLGGGSSGGSGGSSGSKSSPMGGRTPNVGHDLTKGLDSSSGGLFHDSRANMRALKSAARSSREAAGSASAGGARAGASTSFDGGAGKGGPTGRSAQVAAGSFAYEASAANLKAMGTPNLEDDKKDDKMDDLIKALEEDIEGKDAGADNSDMMGQQLQNAIMAAAIGGAVGGAVGGAAGQIMAQVLTQSIQSSLQQSQMKEN